MSNKEVRTKVKKTTVIAIDAADVLQFLAKHFADGKEAEAHFVDDYGDTAYPTSVVITFTEDDAP